MVHLLIDIDSALHARLKHMAVDKESTLKDLVIALLERGVGMTTDLKPSVQYRAFVAG